MVCGVGVWRDQLGGFPYFMRVPEILSTPQFGNTVKNGDSFQCRAWVSKIARIYAGSAPILRRS